MCQWMDYSQFPLTKMNWRQRMVTRIADWIRDLVSWE